MDHPLCITGTFCITDHQSLTQGTDSLPPIKPFTSLRWAFPYIWDHIAKTQRKHSQVLPALARAREGDIPHPLAPLPPRGRPHTALLQWALPDPLQCRGSQLPPAAMPQQAITEPAALPCPQCRGRQGTAISRSSQPQRERLSKPAPQAEAVQKWPEGIF